MFRSILFAAIITCSLVVTSSAQQPEVMVYLKDGKVLPGKIIRQSDLIVQFKDLDGNIHVLFPEDIKKIVKTPDQPKSTGEIQRSAPGTIPEGDPETILLIDGTSLKGHIVALDANDLVVESETGRLVISKKKIRTIHFIEESEPVDSKAKNMEKTQQITSSFTQRSPSPAATQKENLQASTDLPMTKIEAKTIPSAELATQSDSQKEESRPETGELPVSYTKAIYLMDGTRIIGNITKQDERYLVVSTVSGELNIQREEVLSIEHYK